MEAPEKNPDDAKTTPGARAPWVPSQTDVLADDWCNGEEK